MIRRSTILRNLRARRASLGRFVWVLFAFASVSAGAAPCFAMSVAAAPFEHQASHTGAAAGHDHAHPAAHDYAVSEQPAEQSPKSSCPHCPLSVAMSADASSSSHSLCSAGEDTLDAGKLSVSVPVFKYIAWTVRVELAPADLRPSTAWTKHLAVDETLSTVALNLRHCVFLI